MAKVIINENACVGCGLCIQLSPEAFEYGDDGIAKIKDQDFIQDGGYDFRDIVDNCPVEAMTIKD